MTQGLRGLAKETYPKYNENLNLKLSVENLNQRVSWSDFFLIPKTLLILWYWQNIMAMGKQELKQEDKLRRYFSSPGREDSGMDYGLVVEIDRNEWIWRLCRT